MCYSARRLRGVTPASQSSVLVRGEEHMTWRSVVGCTLAAVLGLASSANAALIDGTLGIGGGVFYDTLDPVGGAIIDFDPTGGGEGDALVVKAATGYFTGIGVSFGDELDIYDLTNVAAAAGVAPAGPMYAPAGVDLTTVPTHFGENFLHSFEDSPGLHFDLQYILLQSGTPCVTGLETTCVLGPFVLTETEAGLRISFDVLGWFRNGLDEGFFSGAFSTTFLGLTMEDARDRLTTGQDLKCQTTTGEVTCTFDANFAPSVIPEPATLLTFGLGSAALAAVRRRRAKKGSIS